MIRIALPLDIVGNLQHVICRLNGFAGDLISALGHNHGDHLLHHVHVGHFQISLGDGTQTTGARRSGHGLAGCIRGFKQIVSHTVQTGGIQKGVKFDVPDRISLPCGIERCHRTVNDYAIVGNEHHPVADLQSILDDAVVEMAIDLPSRAEGCAGRTPAEAHPELFESRRHFRAELELALFNLQCVDAFLSTFTWTRKANKTGQICIGGQRQRYSVGRAYAQQDVGVRFDPADRHFVFYWPKPEQVDQAQDALQEVGRRPARNLDVEDLTGLATWPDGLLPQQLPLPLCFVEG